MSDPRTQLSKSEFIKAIARCWAFEARQLIESHLSDAEERYDALLEEHDIEHGNSDYDWSVTGANAIARGFLNKAALWSNPKSPPNINQCDNPQ